MARGLIVRGLLLAWDSWRRTSGDDRRQQSSEESTCRRIRTLCGISLFLRDLYAIGLTQLSSVSLWNVSVCTCICTVYMYVMIKKLHNKSKPQARRHTAPCCMTPGLQPQRFSACHPKRASGSSQMPPPSLPVQGWQWVGFGSDVV
jgi:hypothetical protein